ncbi:replication protein RepA [Siccirubricoccus phaeus]|uniref:replication protein RepA n=1 Tax=Siccirubricoccus phaeus TaxID=2595053 RepID=UPI0011F2EBF0|nr:replication protein RepA [Siccirubricoccus phaeus]
MQREVSAELGLPRRPADYFASLQHHAVPLNEPAIAALSHSSMGLDIYAWLAQRLHRIPTGSRAFIPWPMLQSQFGAEYARLRKFREVFMEALRQVATVYPAAKIDVNGQGLFLYPSLPPVPKTRLLVSK